MALRNVTKKVLAPVVMLLIAMSLSAVSPEGYSVVGSTDKGILLYDQQRADVALLNRATGHMWTSILSEDAISSTELGSQWVSRARSLFELNYSIPSDENIYFASEETQACEIDAVFNPDSLTIHIDLTDIQIRFDMVFSLTADGMQLVIPFDSLDEYGENTLISLTPIPFFGAADDTVDGYAFYPDGSGALHDFGTAHPEYLHEYRAMVYNRPVLDVDSDVYAAEPVLIPVYGMRHGDDGFVAYALEGDTDMNIFFSPSGYRIDVNRIGSEFVYRHRYNIKRSNVVSKSTQSLNTVVEIIDQDVIPGDRVLNYDLLSGSEASYSGMAVRYRTYLEQHGLLSDVIAPADRIPVSITTLLGIKEEQILLDRYISMTTFGQVGKMIEQLSAAGTGPLVFDFIGWERDGYRRDPVTVPISRKIGGRDGLRRLIEMYPEHAYHLVFDEMRARKTSGGFSIYGDVLKNPLGLVITDALGMVYLISPNEAQKRLEKKILPYLKGVPLDGIKFVGLGNLLLMDEYDGERIMRTDNLQRSLSMARSVQEQFGSAGVYSGNAYMLGSISSLSEVPMKDSGFLFTDRAVPFYQMVIHGSIPYTGRPGNLHWDLQELKLQWVEYGYNPAFELTWLDAIELKDTSYSRLFNSSFAQWKDQIGIISREFNTNLQGIYDSRMIDHSRIDGDLAAVTYENGTVVLINHAAEAVTYSGTTIAPHAYAVVSQESLQ